MSLRLVYEMKEDIVDGPPDECTQIQEFAINPMQCGLEKVAFTRVLGVEELK
jgi:hypothetical protein